METTRSHGDDRTRGSSFRVACSNSSVESVITKKRTRSLSALLCDASAPKLVAAVANSAAQLRQLSLICRSKCAPNVRLHKWPHEAQMQAKAAEDDSNEANFPRQQMKSEAGLHAAAAGFPCNRACMRPSASAGAMTA